MKRLLLPLVTVALVILLLMPALGFVEVRLLPAPKASASLSGAIDGHSGFSLSSYTLSDTRCTLHLTSSDKACRVSISLSLHKGSNGAIDATVTNLRVMEGDKDYTLQAACAADSSVVFSPTSVSIHASVQGACASTGAPIHLDSSLTAVLPR